MISEATVLCLKLIKPIADKKNTTQNFSSSVWCFFFFGYLYEEPSCTLAKLSALRQNNGLFKAFTEVQRRAAIGSSKYA